VEQTIHEKDARATCRSHLAKFKATIFLNVALESDLEILHIASPFVAKWSHIQKDVSHDGADVDLIRLLKIKLSWTEENFQEHGDSRPLPLMALDFWLCSSIHTDKCRGVYITEDNLLVSHMEPCEARRMFPCVDNPDAAAHFRLRILVGHQDWSIKDVISNTPQKEVHTLTKDQLNECIRPNEQNDFQPRGLWNSWSSSFGEQTSLESYNIPTTHHFNHFIRFVHHQNPIALGEILNSASSISTRNTERLHLVEFHETPLMCTYLLTFVIGEFHKLEKQITLISSQNKQDTQNVLLRGFIPKELVGARASDCEWALWIAELCLQFFFDKFPTVRYPLPKLDLIGVHLDPLAMENVGAVTFSCEYLIVNNKTSEDRKKRITRLLFHEISHQFFGNIARIKDWKYLWMKEGVARLLEYQLVDYYFKEWNFFDNFLADIFLNALQLDEKDNTHAIQSDITTLDGEAALKRFDAISYGKAASVLRMLVSYLGHDTFWSGLSSYMDKFQYQSTVAENLWQCLREASVNVDVSSIMDEWILKAGHPLLIVDQVNPVESEDKEGSNDTTSFSIRQFYCVNSVENRDIRDTLLRACNYTIPVQIKSLLVDGHIEITKMLITSSHSIIKLPAAKYHLFNFDHCGFYRTFYSQPHMWEMCLEAIKDGNFLNSREILGFLYDASFFLMYPNGHPCHLTLNQYFKLLLLAKKYSKLKYVAVHILDKLRTVCYMCHTRSWSPSLYRFSLYLTEELISVRRIEELARRSTRDDTIPDDVQVK